MTTMIEVQVVFENPTIPSIVRLTQFLEGDDFFEEYRTLRESCEEELGAKAKDEQVFIRLFTRDDCTHERIQPGGACDDCGAQVY